MLATATVLFYDYLLTLADEVSQTVSVPLPPAYYHCEDQIRLAWEEDMGYAESIICCVPRVVNDEIVFGLFLAVRLLQQSPSILNERCRTGISQWDTSSGY